LKNVKLILASFCLVLVGCSDDDDPASSTSYTLSGTYNVTAVSLGDDCDSLVSGMCEDQVSADEAACTAAGSTWMSLFDMMGEDEIPTITFVDDGTCGEGCTYTCSSATSCTLFNGGTLTVNADGTVTSTIADSWEAYCTDDSDMEEYDTYTTQEACEANGSAEGAGDGVWEEAGSDCTEMIWTAASGS
tara:strand:+ start:348 stop:914 length:567 start_codon:yes stop_codon:yes gene_type:complete